MTSDRKNEENNLECVSCGVDTFSEQMNGPIITRNKHKDWCLLVALWRLDESVKSKPWRVAVQDLAEVCEKYAAEKFAASIRAETLEECCKAVCDVCREGKLFKLSTTLVEAENGLWRHTTSSKDISVFCRASAIRDAGKKEVSHDLRG